MKGGSILKASLTSASRGKQVGRASRSFRFQAGRGGMEDPEKILDQPASIAVSTCFNVLKLAKYYTLFEKTSESSENA